MKIKEATLMDYDKAFDFIEKLWDYNHYDKEAIQKIYEAILMDNRSFAFFAMEGNEYVGFCHGTCFMTFWLSGNTCYLSSLITAEEKRGKGYGRFMIDHVKIIAKEKACKAIILDSGFPREKAHQFYEQYGFTKSCYGFDLELSEEER